MKKVMCLSLSLFLAACAIQSQKEVTPPPQPVVQPKPPVSTVFRSWYQLRRKDVEDARRLEESVRRLNGIPIEAVIGRVAQKDDEGKMTVVEIWKGINLGVPPTQLHRQSADLRKAITLSAEFAGNRSAQTNLEIHVATVYKKRVAKWLDEGLSKSGGALATNVIWKPLKRGDLPFIRIEPSDPGYAFGPLS